MAKLPVALQGVNIRSENVPKTVTPRGAWSRAQGRARLSLLGGVDGEGVGLAVAGGADHVADVV